MRFPICTAPSSELAAAALPRAVVAPALVRLFLIVVAAGVLVFVSPARPSSATTPTPTEAPTATPPAAGSPLAEIIDFIADMNAGDLPSVYAALSPDVQQQFTLAELTEAIQDITLAAGPLHFTIVSVDSATETGDQAELELTIRVQAGSSLDITLQEVASLVRIDGVWRVADHFLQSAFTAIGLVQPGPLVRTFDAQGCVSGDVLEGVYAPSRLLVLEPCVTVTGVVHGIEYSLDGDITFNLALPADKTYLLNEDNLRDQDGMLHIEIIPGDQQRVATPNEGDRVTVTGPWVNDTIHGHNEIHPAWLIAPKPPLSVGGVSLDPQLPGSSGGKSGLLGVIAGAMAAAVALSGGVWYARRRPAASTPVAR
jgi:hypothetical protein